MVVGWDARVAREQNRPKLGLDSPRETGSAPPGLVENIDSFAVVADHVFIGEAAFGGGEGRVEGDLVVQGARDR